MPRTPTGFGLDMTWSEALAVGDARVVVDRFYTPFLTYPDRGNNVLVSPGYDSDVASIEATKYAGQGEWCE